MASNLYFIYTQFFPPRPTLHPGNLPSQAGKVFIVTGGSSGIGYHLSKALYQAGGTVYIFARGHTNASDAISSIQSAPLEKNPHWSTPGKMKYINVDLADLRTIKPAVEEFLKQESRLDVLFNNAGVGSIPVGTKTTQGLEPNHGINCVGPHLLTKLLLPILTSTAKTAPKASVRIVWTSSVLVDTGALPGGVKVDELDNWAWNAAENYTSSKTGNWFLASEYANRYGKSGIVSLTQNPGSLVTNVWRNTPWYLYYPFVMLLGKAEDGAATNLWAGVGEKVGEGDGGRYAIPFGRWHGCLREDLLRALKGNEEGGTGQAGAFFEWCEGKVREFE